MESSPSRPKTALVGLTVIVLLAYFVWSREAEQRAHRDARIRAAALTYSARMPQGVQPHAPLLGDSVHGEAIENYGRAVALCGAALPCGDDSTDPWALSQLAELPPDIARRLAKYEPALDALATGAAAATIDLAAARRPLTVRSPGPTDFPFVANLVTLAALVVRHDLASGNGSAAVRRTADLMTLQLDFLRGTASAFELLAAEGVTSVCCTWTDDRIASLDEPNRAALRDLLARFDAALPPIQRSFEGDLTLAARWLDRDDRERDHVSPPLLAAIVASIERLASSEAAPWSVRRQALVAQAPTLAYPEAPDFAAVETARRTATAHLRLLIVALGHHLGEPLPSLRDPLGDGDLEVERPDASTIVVRSAGLAPDGKRIERTAKRR